jgi:hypothetical protein
MKNQKSHLRRWYSFGCSSEITRDKLRKYLYKKGIEYEVSGAGSRFHFEARMTEQEYDQLVTAFDAEKESYA